MITVLVCGGRDFGNVPIRKDGNGPDKEHPDYAARWAELEFIMGKLEEFAVKRSRHYVPDDNWLPSDIRVISGAARGADTVAINWAVTAWCDFKEFPADWTKYGKAAGPIRNQQMLDEGKPDVVLAFPGGRGTADMVQRARKAGVEVIEFSYP